MKKMKVLYLLNSTIMGGATISFINMIKGLSAYGVQPIVIIPQNKDNGDELIRFFQQNQITYYRKTLISSSFPKPLNVQQLIKTCLSCILMYIRRCISYYELLAVVKEQQPDIIHTNVGVIREGLYVAKKTNTPHVLHIREYQDKDFGWIFVPSKSDYKRFVRHSDAVITITNDLRYYFELQDFPKARTIYNGIYSKDCTILNMEKQPYFCCACRIVPGKGYEDVIEAFNLFFEKHPNYELKIAGQGEKEYIEQLMKLIEEKRCRNHIKLLGHLNDVRPLMANAKALLVASRSEGFGRMTAEACFNGCIVIGRNTGGTKEILQVTGGFLFDDIDTLVSRMEGVTRLSTSEYRNIALSAQAKAISLYSTESHSQHIYNLYKGLI